MGSTKYDISTGGNNHMTDVVLQSEQSARPLPSASISRDPKLLGVRLQREYSHVDLSLEREGKNMKFLTKPLFSLYLHQASSPGRLERTSVTTTSARQGSRRGDLRGHRGS